MSAHLTTRLLAQLNNRKLIQVSRGLWKEKKRKKRIVSRLGTGTLKIFGDLQ